MDCRDYLNVVGRVLWQCAEDGDWSGAWSLWRNMGPLAGGCKEGRCSQEDVVVSVCVNQKIFGFSVTSW